MLLFVRGILRVLAILIHQLLLYGSRRRIHLLHLHVGFSLRSSILAGPHTFAALLTLTVLTGLRAIDRTVLMEIFRDAVV